MEEISKSKKQFHEEWEKTVKMIEDTQKNVDVMREQIKSHGGEGHHHPVKQAAHSSKISQASYLSSSHKKDRRQAQEEFMLLHSNRSNRLLQIKPETMREQS